jgi:hypothetical protein
MVPVGDKIKALAKAKDCPFPSSPKALGYERADNFYSIVSGRSKPAGKLLKPLPGPFPDVNLDWLLRDDPEMFISRPVIPQPPAPTVVSEPSIELLQVELRAKQAQLEEKEKRLADKDKIIQLLEKAAR